MGSKEGMEWLHKEAHKTNESSLVESNCAGPESQNVAAQKQTRQERLHGQRNSVMCQWDPLLTSREMVHLKNKR